MHIIKVIVWYLRTMLKDVPVLQGIFKILIYHYDIRKQSVLQLLCAFILITEILLTELR